MCIQGVDHLTSERQYSVLTLSFTVYVCDGYSRWYVQLADVIEKGFSTDFSPFLFELSSF